MKTARIAILGYLFLLSSLTSAWGSVTTAPPVAGPPARPVDTQRLKWRNNVIRIAVSNSLTRVSSNIKTDSDVLGAIRRSLQTWSNAADVELQMELTDRQNVSPNGPSGDGVSLITVAQTPENVLFFSKDADLASAKTRIFYNRKGAITEADIVLNPFQQFSTDGTYGTFDLESTLTHEIGHLLGLHHTPVWGATMAESFAKNGAMGFVDLGPRTLSQSDVAAIRDLYGPAADDEKRYGSFGGKLLLPSGRPAKGIQLWAEDAASGSVSGQGDLGPDGTFRIGGLPAGDYSIYWRSKESALGSIGKLADYKLDAGENKILNDKIAPRKTDVSVQYLGLNGQLADYGVPLTAGRSFVVNLGGKNLNAGNLSVRFTSPYLRTAPFPLISSEFGENVSGLTFTVMVDADIPSGAYSIFVDRDDEPTSSLIGAITIE